jgi:hypothetical protein
LIRTHLPADSGNELVSDPNFPKKLEVVLDAIKPEAVYFSEHRLLRWVRRANGG